MSHGVIRRILHDLFQNVNCVRGFSLADQNLPLQRQCTRIGRSVFQQRVGDFGGVIQTILLEQEFGIHFADDGIFGMFGVKRGKFRERFVPLPLTQIKFGEHPISRGIVRESLLGILQNFSAASGFPSFT